MKMKQTMLLLLLILILFVRCDTTEPPENKVRLTLTLEDVSCTEAWIKLTTEELTLPAELTLKQYNPGGNSISQILLLSTKDSLLYIDSLLPKQTYNFQATSIQYPVSSNKANATTLDTTSHNFTWQKYYFGDIGASFINDVKVIDYNNIWAVGEIKLRDTVGPQLYQLFNALHWNGDQWNLVQVPSRVSIHNNDLLPFELKSIFVSNENDIMVTDGAQVIYWDGNSWGKWDFLFNDLNDTTFGSINMMDGRAGQIAVAVGNKSNILVNKKQIQWGTWQKINMPSDIDLFDICSIINNSQQNLFYIPVTNFSNFIENEIIEIEPLVKIKRIDAIKTKWFSSLWTRVGTPIYLAGDGIFENKNGNWNNINYGRSNVIERIRGNKLNDIFAAGHFGTVAHYNGSNWYNYIELESNGIFSALSIKENLICIAGIENGRALVVIGRRNQN